LFLAPEGSSEIAVRIQGAIDHKGTIRLEHAPFYWCDECPPLTHPKSADIIIKTAKWAAHEFKERFGLPLVLIVIDTIITAAGYKKEGADNDAATTFKIMDTMMKIGREVGCFVFGIDQFGKDANVGTRGSSAKEAAADVILATLGDKSEGGKVSNCRLALRKRRGGPNGEEFPFHPASSLQACARRSRHQEERSYHPRNPQSRMGVACPPR